MSGELLVSRVGGQVWAALREDGAVVELHAELPDQPHHAGRILKARVTGLLPGIQSAFLEIGEERGGFLHARDLVLPGESDAGARDRAPIEDRLKVGRDLLVQVSRESLGAKGARVTCLISLPGHRLVLSPRTRKRGISRRIRDDAERERLRDILDRLPGEGLGYVARTAAVGASEEELRREAEALLERWAEVQGRAEGAPAPAVLEREPDLVSRLLRDLPSREIERVVFDAEPAWRAARDWAARYAPALVPLIALEPAPPATLERYGLLADVRRALRRRVWLKSGGHLRIEETEALISVDVNTGKFRGRRRQEETVLRTNLEAAGEVARQLRLRDLGGIVVIDFIDMESEESRREVLGALELALRPDRARTRITGIDELGLVRLTRKRTRPGLPALLTDPCPTCRGEGRLRRESVRAMEILLELQRNERPGRTPTLRAHPRLLREVRSCLERERAERGATLVVDLVPDTAMQPHVYELHD